MALALPYRFQDSTQSLPSRLKKRLVKLLYPNIDTPPVKPKPDFEFWIDVVSGCNLRCAACPVGMPEFTNSIGKQLREMDLDVFERICVKAKEETGGKCRFGLYNWTEPTLHSRLHELIACANRHGIPCGISSNLNHRFDWSLLRPLDLCNFTITVSGFTQKTYAINHKGGRIEPVLLNLVEISRVLADTPSYKNIQVRYLVHRDNKHEVEVFKHFCDKLGLAFTVYHAYYMPIDRMFEGLQGVPEGLEYIEYSPRLVRSAIGNYRTSKCALRDGQVVLDVDGNFGVCCVESPTAPQIANFLDTPFRQMQAARFSSELCSKCIDEGINVLATYAQYEPQEVQDAVQRALPFDLKDLISS
ncbi:MAG: radical SAM protein [Cyanobium sp.]